MKDLANVDQFVSIYNDIVERDTAIIANEKEKSKCRKFTGDIDTDSNFDNFKVGKFRTLIVIRKAIEGFDSRNVSVVAVARRCRSRVVFDNSLEGQHEAR